MKDEKVISICMQIYEYIKTVNWKSFSHEKNIQKIRIARD